MSYQGKLPKVRPKSVPRPGPNATPVDHDNFYYNILSSVTNLNCTMDLLNFLCFSNAAFPLGKGIKMLAEILGYSTDKLQVSLNELDSVTSLPDLNYSDEHPDDIKRPLRVVPQALREFITDETRSKEFYIDPQTAYSQLAQTFLLHLPSVFSDIQETSAPCVYLSCHLFVPICTKVVAPADDLWRDLFELDLKSYFHLLRQTGLPQREIFNVLSRLLLWFKDKEYHSLSTLGFKKSLYLHHLAIWDDLIGSALRSFTKRVYTSNALTYVLDPSYMSKEKHDRISVYEILTFGHPESELRNPDCVVSEDNVCVLGARYESDRDFTTMLIDYLEDPSRGGELWGDVDKHVTMTRTLAEFLFKHKVPYAIQERSYTSILDPPYGLETSETTFLYAARWITLYLPKATYDDQLAEYLSSHTLAIRQSCPEKVEFDQAVEKYLSKKHKTDDTKSSTDSKYSGSSYY
ncbi:hypothetical protein CPC08DRAFT_716841 [Agrocybe pediades]|nr:hypothetical protein CPC08DRAFT_716841 [Agrocybe pediades]